MYPIIQILGRSFGTYGLCMAVAILLIAWLACLRAKELGVCVYDVLIAGALTLGFGLLGGNILYICVTYTPAQVLEIIKAGQLSMLAGGLVFYGSLLGAVVGAWLGARIAGAKLETLLGTAVTYIPLGHAVGRIGCLLAGCCHGMEYSGPLAVFYPDSLAGLSPEQGYFPVQLLEAILNVGIFLILNQYQKRAKRPYHVLALYVSLYAVNRFCLEFLRGDLIRGIYAGLSLSQWISIFLLFACGVYITIEKKHRSA